MGGTQRRAMTDGEYLPLTKITDGLSCTILIVEQAGRPEKWRSGKKEEGGSQFGMGSNARADDGRGGGRLGSEPTARTKLRR